MHQSKLLLPTMREAPSDAIAISHQYMLRAGLIRPVASGIYTYLALGRRVLHKVAAIVREELDKTEAQEILMPAMQPAELWEQSGRYSVYGPELMRLRDRHHREFALGPTHEEVITSLIRDEVSSYRKLPLLVYQIQTKFRDERRPRYGLIRAREFMMKDAYSFNTDWESLDRTYWQMYEAYERIFTRCGLTFRAVEADAGAIGGEGDTHEFMALADIGEDTVVTCTECHYSANLEKASSRPPKVAASTDASSREMAAPVPKPEKIHTPEIRTIRQLTDFFGIKPDQLLKTLIYSADGQPVAVVIRGDHEVNEAKLKNALQANHVELADEETTRSITGAPVGFAGPVGLNVPLWVDQEAASVRSGIAGANEQDYHLHNVHPGRDFSLDRVGDLRNVKEGECCPYCYGELKFYRGIEVGHVFKLGTKYSEPLEASYLDKAGQQQTMVMGCYGIGLSRVLSAVIEQNHDGDGIVWPFSIAPYQVHLIPVSVQDPVQCKLAEELYQRLSAAGVEVLIDDREERPGVKFKDSDLIGIPVRIVIGKQASEGLIEFKERKSTVQQVLTIEEALSRIQELVKANTSDREII
ncbi:proline--tRNA ligase [Paenibacillus sp. J2TS4]|uniref:proline--tRNA ligase n=1 Tax=Paenibacillus sp. J2TS4 TaxID=2807194 RepID=UPI001B144867|nr:proline--tRNA ligase [Paenibacillus sp. J2TS4]GIP32714.1 proline--tRNA ligase [Paenibacillus sp. J2TS4]